MIPIRQVSAHLCERLTLTPLGEPIEVTLTADEEWSPRWQGTLTIPDTLDLSAYDLGGQLWKFQGGVVTLALVTTYGPGLACSDLTGAFGGDVADVTAAHGGSVDELTAAFTRVWHPSENLRPLEAATALWGGSVAAVSAAASSVAQITRALRQPGGSYLLPPDDRLTLALRTRKITPRANGTVLLEIASEDVRLHDYRRTATTAWSNPHTSLRELVRSVLTTVSVWEGIRLEAGGTVTIPTGQEWKPGETAFGYLHPILESVGWTLYADHAGTMHLEPRQATAAPLLLDYDANLLDYEREEDRAGKFFDGAVIEYTDAPTGNPAQRFDVYAMPGAQRIAHETRPGINTIPGAAQRLVERSRERYSTASAAALTLLSLRPAQRATLRVGTFESHGSTVDITHHGTIAALTHSYPAAETTLRLRDVTTY